MACLLLGSDSSGPVMLTVLDPEPSGSTRLCLTAEQTPVAQAPLTERLA